MLWASWTVLDGLTDNPTCVGTQNKCPDGFNCCTSTDIGEWHLCTADQVYSHPSTFSALTFILLDLDINE